MNGTAVLKAILSKSNTPMAGKIGIGTVRGDLHDVCNNLVMVLERGGFEVVNLGVDVSPEKFVETIRNLRPQTVGMSALLTTTMKETKITLKAIKTAVGGAPLTESFAKEIGADGYAPDAASALDVVRSLVSE